MDEEEANADFVTSDITLGATRLEDFSAIIKFVTTLDQADTLRKYDYSRFADYYSGLRYPTYSSSGIPPVYSSTVSTQIDSLVSSDVLGVPMRIPVTDSQASQALKLTLDDSEISFDIITIGTQKYVSFTMKTLGTYRLFYTDTSSTQSADSALPNTGDNSHIMFWLMIFALSFFISIGAFINLVVKSINIF
ncbi:hypothetical protein [uncultured Bacteroides sp.]|uniref:hypothetical protein n=1 Tax=uncultured Bacteroides sp. TaxID=162156 RepID=UPI002AABAB57|nr:hypothetical protein [uncultured Bacteroides sp.]